VINNKREDKKKHKEDNETEREKYLEERIARIPEEM
jgi:hypothetical protein